jgi:carbon-monoxide dehydrogenase medium subunit
VIPASVEYLRPASLEEALSALQDPDTSVLAGGHSLLPMMKLRLAQPSRVLDIGRLELGGIRLAGSALEIGALATWSEVAASPVVQERWSAVADCAAVIGDLQVRNWGTIGGGVAHADPAADMPAALLALDASVRLASRDGTRDVPATQFFVGPFTTTRQEQELVVAIVVAEQPAGQASAYSAFKDPASGYPLAGAAARLGLEGGRLSFVAAAFTGLSGRAFLDEQVAERLSGATPADAVALAGEALAAIEIPDEPRIDGVYRRQLGRVALRRALTTAIQRAEEAGE